MIFKDIILKISKNILVFFIITLSITLVMLSVQGFDNFLWNFNKLSLGPIGNFALIGYGATGLNILLENLATKFIIISLYTYIFAKFKKDMSLSFTIFWGIFSGLFGIIYIQVISGI